MERQDYDQIQLFAGPVAVVFRDGEIRSISINGQEVVNRIYFALRGENWQNVQSTVAELTVEKSDDSFQVRYKSEYGGNPPFFVSDTCIQGFPDGDLLYQMEGTAVHAFRRNRIGICVLHPISAAADQVIITHPDGTLTKGEFPRTISPHQPFKDIAAIDQACADGLRITFRFSGDIFEMEDQRNWSDGSLKTYSTPLELPFPVEVPAGTHLAQSIRLSFSGRQLKSGCVSTMTSRTRFVRKPCVLALDDAGRSFRFPRLGLDYGTDQPPGNQELDKIALLRLSFLRVELCLSNDDYPKRLQEATGVCKALAVPMALAVRLGDSVDRQLADLFGHLDSALPDVCSLLVLSEGFPTTSAGHLRAARSHLTRYRRQIPLGAGTRAYFAELNRFPPELDLLDFVSYPVNPQVHATDELSIVETLAGQRATVESALVLSGAKPVHVGPVTLRPQWNPAATSPQESPGGRELPEEVDPRQRLPFAAAWTLGSFKALSVAGAQSVTYYQTVGWKGVMESLEGSPNPELFPSHPAELFPVHAVLRALGEIREGRMFNITSEDPLAVDAFKVQDGARTCVFIANLMPTEARVVLSGISSSGDLRALAGTGRREARDREIAVLGRYATVQIDG